MSEKTVLGTLFIQSAPQEKDMVNADVVLQGEARPEAYQLAQYAKKNSDIFSNIVALCSKNEAVPIVALNDLMRLCWCVVGSGHVKMMLGLEVTTIGFTFEKMPKVNVPVIACPWNWFAKCRKDVFYQVGAVISVASYIRDYWNQKYTLGSVSECMQRAGAYEAEYLNWLTTKEQPGYKLDEYQQGIVREFPNGLNSLKTELLHLSKAPPKHPLE